MLHLLYNDHLFNKYTHVLFTARSYLRELIYWPCEFAAALLMFIYILQIDLLPNTIYMSRDDSIIGWQPKPTDIEGIPNSFRTYIDSNGIETRANFGISPISFSKANTVFKISSFDTDLLNREYAWMCLCWFIKHFFYLIEALYLMKKSKQLKITILPLDLVTHVLNMTLWGFWTVYGWIKEGDQIHAGMYERMAKDALNNQNFSYTDSDRAEIQNKLNEREKMRERYNGWYSDSAGWTWLWIPTIIIFAANLLIWVIGLIKKRSSAYTGQSLATVLIPAQLFFLHLFLKGSWIISNYFVNHKPASFQNSLVNMDLIRSYYDAYVFIQTDYFDARWVFWIIFLAAWAGVIFAIICAVKAYLDIHVCKVSAAKYFCYSIFWISAFIWVLCMDNTLYHYFYQYCPALVTTHIICLASAFIVACLSIFEKKRESINFYERHNKWAMWADPYFAYPRSSYNDPITVASTNLQPALAQPLPKNN